jgi:hypothetical protein
MSELSEADVPSMAELDFAEYSPYGQAAYESYVGRKDWLKLPRHSQQIWIDVARAAIKVYHERVMLRS